MSEQRPTGVPGGGVMRRLCGGAGTGRFGGLFEFADAIFSPSKTAARVEREEQSRRRVAVPAPGDPPADAPVEAIVALPTGLLGPIEPTPEGPAPSASGEQTPPRLE